MTKQEFDNACIAADAKMKASNGHLFMHILKTRCQYCGRSKNHKGKCSAWFQTFLAHLGGELVGVVGAPTKP